MDWALPYVSDVDVVFVHEPVEGADDGTALRRRVEAAADHFVDTTTMNFAQQAERIWNEKARRNIDIAAHRLFVLSVDRPGASALAA